LTPRERQIAALIGEGLKYDAIARRLGVSPATVSTYAQRIRARLKVSSRTQIATWVGQRTQAGHPDIALPELPASLSPAEPGELKRVTVPGRRRPGGSRRQQAEDTP
jgi:DNA-binding CsgD family transcriptional regulator